MTDPGVRLQPHVPGRKRFPASGCPMHTRAKNINALDVDRIQMHNRIGNRRKANPKGIGNVFPKIPRRSLERVGIFGVAGLTFN
jgi:hypothetical protein